MPSNHLILCRPLLLPPPIFPSIRVFSNESVLRIRWPKYWSVSFSISPSNEYSGLISFRMDWLDLLAVQGTLKSLLQHHSSKTSRRPNQYILKEMGPELTHWKRLWSWEGLWARGEGDDRGWDGWMVSPNRWTWVWVNSGSWWWTGRPGVLRCMGSQRVGHDWATELNWESVRLDFLCSVCWHLQNRLWRGLKPGEMVEHSSYLWPSRNRRENRREGTHDQIYCFWDFRPREANLWKEKKASEVGQDESTTFPCPVQVALLWAS